MKAGNALKPVMWVCALTVIVVSCGDDDTSDADPASPVTAGATSATSTGSTTSTTTSTLASTPASSAATTTDLAASSTTTASSTETSPATTTTTEPKIVIPTGILAAMPTQNRVDPAKGQFQVKIVNGTDERFTIVGVQFVWDGFTTALTERSDIVVSGQRIDLPVKFPGATCVGDGTLATMPDLASARARLVLDDGTERTIPVYDVDHLARRLYLEDCERQMIESLVGIEWVDLRTVEFDGRPVTAGALRLTRRASTETVSVQSVSNNVLFAFEAADAPVDGPVVTLAEGVDEASAPIRFIESRCDPHAISEASQPFKFIAQVDLGGGDVHPFIVVPPVEAQVPMRQTMEAACIELGEVEFLGTGEDGEDSEDETE